MGRFSHFTDDEVYMLKRQAMESSFEIVCMGKYSDEEGEIHENLLNEALDECRKRRL